MATTVWSWEDYGLADRLYQLTFLDCRGPYAFPFHRHGHQWEVVYVHRGRLRHRLEGRVVDQEAGEFRLIREADGHSLAGEGFSFSNLAFPLSFVEAWASAVGLSSTDGWNRLVAGPEVPSGTIGANDRPGFEAALEVLLHGYDPLAFTVFFTQLIDRCLVREPAAGAPLGGVLGGTAPAPAWLSQALVRARAAGRVPDLDEWFAWCGFSPEHVARTVRRVCGCTPTELLRDLRLDRAAALLVQTNRGAQQIGADVGFANSNYFHRCFRARFGSSPGAYRRAQPRPHRDPAV